MFEPEKNATSSITTNTRFQLKSKSMSCPPSCVQHVSNKMNQGTTCVPDVGKQVFHSKTATFCVTVSHSLSTVLHEKRALTHSGSESGKPTRARSQTLSYHSSSAERWTPHNSGSTRSNRSGRDCRKPEWMRRALATPLREDRRLPGLERQ